MTKNRTAKLFLISLLLLFLSVFYYKIVLNPNGMLFSGSGDAMKNYYVYTSYIKNSNQILNFDQMNYPYGESILYTDCMPILSLPLKLLSSFFPSLSNYSIGIFNIIILLSFFVTAIILFEIFIYLKTNKALAVLGALGITLLSPQVLRLQGHFSLSFAFVIPLIILFILKNYFYWKQIKKIGIVVLIIFLTFFIHTYLGAISAGILVVYSLILLVLKPFYKKEIAFQQVLLAFITGVFPLLFFLLLSAIIDTHTGRTTNPWGFFHYHADWSTVFLPYNGFLNHIKQDFFPDTDFIMEKASYIGFGSILMLAFFVLQYVIYIPLRAKGKKPILKINSIPLMGLFVTGVIFLFISMAYPFRLGYEELLDLIPQVKQFRALSRFSWVFYFVSTILSIYFADMIFKKIHDRKKNIELNYLLLFLLPFSFIVESIGHHKKNYEFLTESKSPFILENLSGNLQNVIDTTLSFKEKYQAIIPLPFYHLDSENFGIYRQELNNHFTFSFNYFTGIPMLSNMSARTSIWESKNIMQVFSSSFYQKEIQSDLQSKKPFLLLFNKNNTLTPQENSLLEKSILITENEKYYLGKLTHEALFKNSNAKEWNQYFKIKDQLLLKKGFWVSDTNAFFSFNDFGFDEEISFYNYKNSLSIGNVEFTLIDLIEKGELEVGATYIANFWIYNNGDNYGQDATKGHAFIDKIVNGMSNWLSIKLPTNSFEINKNWTLVKLEITANEPIADHHRVIFKKSLHSNHNTYIKDALFYKKDLIIYKEMTIDGSPYLFMNNHRIKKTE